MRPELLAGKRVVVVGAGNMGGAIVKGLVASKAAAAGHVTAVDIDAGLLSRLRDEVGVRTAAEAKAAASDADVVVLAVKPQAWKPVTAPFFPALSARQVVVSIMAGVTTGAIEAALPGGVPVVRVMPNLMAQVGAAASALCAGRQCGPSHTALAEAVLSSVGDTVWVDESQMDAVTGLSGSGPAFVFVMIDALADGGVRAGLPRPVALRLAAQTVFGAARMVLSGTDSPMNLKDRVTSPGGTTIAGIAALEQGGFRAAVMAAVEAAARRSKELGGG